MVNVPDPETLATWHYPDTERSDGQWTLCHIPRPRDPVGVVVPCEGCMAELKRRRHRGEDPGWKTPDRGEECCREA